ncbi:melanocortin receptor 4-like [Stylophora pistillata]|uniref:melanocortin receptor 4-like n=1 Tax=Stylophora pistillata TaxID=50429 RepID=UPI000C054B12|nr:melanocortin receptor 4-like [Stylophora pistillata]XP_022787829.1 melanocortin receptor 4-like [Stylophora pistillata]
MDQYQMNLFNQTCWNCSTSLPKQTTPEYTRTSELLTKNDAIILTIICALASVIGSLGNSLVLVTVSSNKNLRTIPDLFITSLAFSDFTVCAIFLPMLVYDFNQDADEKSEAELANFDLVRSFLGHTSMVASATNMFAVTVDRVSAIRFPFRYAFMATKNALVGILVVWIISITFGVLYAPNLVSRIYIALYCSVLLITTMIVYVYIFIVAKRQENRIQSVQMGTDGVLVEKKVAKTIFTVVGVYALCWLPLLLLPAIIDFKAKPDQFGKGFNWAHSALSCNSAVNPFIYCLRSSKYRTAFGKILRIERWNG